MDTNSRATGAARGETATVCDNRERIQLSTVAEGPLPALRTELTRPLDPSEHGGMQPNPQVKIIKDPDYRDGYSNSVQVRVSFWDFFLQFGKIGNQSQEQVDLNVFQGVYLSPQQAKALHTVLAENLKQYEQAFGEIKFDASRTRPEAIQ